MTRMPIHGAELGYDRDTGMIYFKGQPVSIVDALRYDGRVFYVSSVDGAAGSSGQNPKDAITTVTLALAKCTANRGDVILLGPGHNEIIGNETLAWAKAGVQIIGLGSGDKQAQFNHNHASAKITIGANSMALRNIRFSADVTSVAVGIDILAGFTDCQITGCRFDTVTGGTDEYTIGVQNNVGCDRTLFQGNVFDMGIAACAQSIKITGASDRVTIRANEFYGDASASHITGITTLSTRVLIEKNLIVQGVGGDIGAVAGITLLTGTTGIIRDNDIVANLATMAAAVVADTCLWYRNYYNEDIGLTGAQLGTASADD
jgi:hypothetical protein